jgi:hypothetical protein
MSLTRKIVGRIAKDRGCPAPFISLAKLPDFRASPHSNRCFPSCHKSPLRLTTLLGIVGNTSSGAGGEVAISAMSRSISATSNPVSVTSNPWAGSSSISSPSSTARSSRSHPACSAMRLSAISYSAKNSVGRKFFRILPSSLKRRRMPPVGQKARAPSPRPTAVFVGASVARPNYSLYRNQAHERGPGLCCPLGRRSFLAETSAVQFQERAESVPPWEKTHHRVQILPG